MKKILFLCDGDNFPKGAFRFIQQIRENEPVFAKGLFFTSIDTEQLIPIGFMPVSEPYVKLKEEEKILVKKSQDIFSKECEAHGIKYQLHAHEGSWDKELFIKESRFSDLVVISEELFCRDVLDVQPNYFMGETLRVSESPVVVVPENFEGIDRLAIAYDGGKEAMFALKQFAYLFPGYTDLPADFVHIKDEKADDIPDRELLQEYASSHFDALFASKLHFDAKKYFTSWLENKKNVFLVAGSYSRSSFSNTFRQSFADKVIAKHACPVFIAHFS
jgi:hypothetical protein